MICRRLRLLLVFIIIYSYSQCSYAVKYKVLLEDLPLESELKVVFYYQDDITLRGRNIYYNKLLNQNSRLIYNNIHSLKDRLMLSMLSQSAIIDIDNTTNNNTSDIDNIFIGSGFNEKAKIDVWPHNRSLKYYNSIAPDNKKISQLFLLGSYKYIDDKSTSLECSYRNLDKLGYFLYDNRVCDDMNFKTIRDSLAWLNRGVHIYIPSHEISNICLGYTFPTSTTSSSSVAKQLDENYPAQDVNYNIHSYDNAIIMNAYNTESEIKAHNKDMSKYYITNKNIGVSALTLHGGGFKQIINRGAIAIVPDKRLKRGERSNNLVLNAIYIKCMNNSCKLINLENAYIGVTRDDHKSILDKNDYAIICTGSLKGLVTINNYGYIEGNIHVNNGIQYSGLSTKDRYQVITNNYGTIKSKSIIAQLSRYATSVNLFNKPSGRIITEYLEFNSITNDGYIQLKNCSCKLFTINGTLELIGDLLDYKKFNLNAGKSSALVKEKLELTSNLECEKLFSFATIISKNVSFNADPSAITLENKLSNVIEFDNKLIIDSINSDDINQSFHNKGIMVINKQIGMNLYNDGDLYLKNNINYTNKVVENKKNIYVDGVFNISPDYFKNQVNSLLLADNIELSQRVDFTNRGTIQTKSGGKLIISSNNYINDNTGKTIVDTLESNIFINITNKGYLKANTIVGKSNILENKAILDLSYSLASNIINLGSFYINSKKSLQVAGKKQQTNSGVEGEYFSRITNQGGKLNFILTDLQAPKNITYPLLLCDSININNHSKIILEQSSSVYLPTILQQNALQPKKITILKANSIIGTDITNKLFRDNFLFYIKDVTDKKSILKVDNISFAKKGNKQELSATLEWHEVSKASDFPKLDSDNCYNLRDINVYFGSAIYDFNIIEQDKQNLFYIKTGQAVIGKATVDSSATMITIDSSQPNSNNPAIIVEISKTLSVQQITIEATIDATIDVQNKSINNIAVKFCPNKNITDSINAIEGSLRYHALMPKLELAGAVINNALIQGKYGINIALPLQGNLKNNSKIIGKDAAIKIEGPANIILGNIENYGLVKSNNYAILMDSQTAHYNVFKEYIKTKQQNNVLPITNSGTIDGSIVTSGNIYLANKALIISATIEHIYGSLNLENAVSGKINIQAITNASNSTIVVNNAGSFKSDNIQINELHNKNRGMVTTANVLSLYDVFSNQGSITVNELRVLNEITITNKNRARLVVNKLSQGNGIIDNKDSYFEISTLNILTTNTSKNNVHQNTKNSILKINMPVNSQILPINNDNSCLDIHHQSKFNKYDSTSGVLKILIPDNPNDITTDALLKIDTEAFFSSKATARPSRFALYAKNPTILPYAVTVTLLEAHNITGDDIHKHIEQMQTFLAGVDLDPGSKTSKDIIIISNPILDTKVTPNKLQAQIRWWNITGGFPKLYQFNTYNMEDALLSYLPFIDGLKVVEYDHNKNWYIAKREVILGKKFTNDSAKHIYASANPVNKQAIKIEVDKPTAIRKILVQGNIDASRHIIFTNKKNYTVNQCGLLITGKELSVTEGIYIEAKNSLISSLSSTLNASMTYKTAAILLENTITANIYNYGEISGLNGIGIAGNANLLNGTITNHNKINVIGNIIFSAINQKQANSKRNFIFCNEQGATAIGGGCLLSGNNITIMNKGLLQITTLTHTNAISILKNNQHAVFNLTSSQNINSTVTMINYGLIQAINKLNLTSLQNMPHATLTASTLKLIDNSSNSGIININNLANNKIFNNSINAMLIVTGTKGLYLNDSKFINKGDIKAVNSVYLDGKFTNQGNIYTNAVVDNNNKLINKKFINITGTSGLSLTNNIDNRGNITVNATLSVISNYNSQGNWLVGGFTSQAKFTNNAGFYLKIATNDLVIKTPLAIVNQGTLEVNKSIKLASNFANDGALIAATVEGVIANTPELNNNGNNYARINVIKDIIINNYASLTINNAIKGKVTLKYNTTTLGKIVTQSGQLLAKDIDTKGKFIIEGKANITNNLIADFLEVASITAIPTKLQVKNLIISDKLINYTSIEANSIKLPRQTEQYGKLVITGVSGLYLDNQINNFGKIDITNGLHIAKEVELTGDITAELLTTSTACNCILAKQTRIKLANIGDINTSNQKIKIINYGELNLENPRGYINLVGDIAIHNNTDYNNNGDVIIHSDVQQLGSLRVGKVSALRSINYILQPNAIAQFTEPIQQPNITLTNSGNLELQPNSSFKSHTYHNNGTITINVTDFINSSTKTSLLTLDDLILNQQKINNNIVLKPVLNSSILDTSYINKPQTLYLLHISNNAFYLDNKNQQYIIDIVQNDINNYLNLTSDSIHGISFSINSTIKSSVVSPSQSLQSGARYLYVIISPTLTYKFTNKNMGFNQQTLQVAELGKHCIKQNSNIWGVSWNYNKSATVIDNNNLIISPYYVITEKNLVSYDNNNLIIGATQHETIYAEATNLPTFIIGSKIDNASTPPVKQLNINNISFSNIQITGRDIIYPRHDVTNRDGVLINGNNTIKILDKINIDQNTSFISGYNKHALHLAAPIIGSMINYGNIGDSTSGYGIYISSAVSLTIDNNNTIEGMLAALMLEPAPYWQHKKSDLIINNHKNIIGNIFITKATQQVNTIINNIAEINSDKIIDYSGGLKINNNNMATIIANEISATYIVNNGTLKINTDKKFVVNNITNTGNLYIKNMVLADNFICSGTLNTSNFDGKGYKLQNSGINKLDNIKDVIIDKYQVLEIKDSISGNVSILANLTLGSNVNITNNANLSLSGTINYNKHNLTNYGSITIKSNNFILSEYFLNEKNANLNIANVLQTQGSVTIGGNIRATALQPITTGSITIDKNSILALAIIDNSSNTSALDFYIQGTLDVSRKTSFAIISGTINIANDNKEGGLLLSGKLQQNKGVLTIDNINTLNNAILEVTDTKFTKIINNNKLAIENNNKLQIPSGSSIESYTPATNSQLIIPIKEDFHLINYPLLHTTNNILFDKTSKIKIILDDNFMLSRQHRTRVKIISSDKILLTSKKTQTRLQLADIQNIFSQLSINHRLIKVIKDSISIEDNGHSVVADIELIDSSSLPSGMYEVEIPLYKKFLGTCQQQETSLTGVYLNNLASKQSYIAIAPYFMAVYSNKILFTNNQLTIGTTTSNNTIKVEDYTSPALVVSIQATPSSTTITNPISIDSINIVNQDINGYQFAYRNTLGEKANQDGLLITRNTKTIQLNTKINIDKNSILAAGENNHALHIAIPLIGAIENSGTIGLPNTGIGVHFSQLITGTLTNNNIIEGKIAAINIELDSATSTEMSIINNSEIKGNILIKSNVNISKIPININNKKNAYILADTIKADNTARLNLINNKGAVIRVNNLSINNATNDGVISIAESALIYNKFNNRAKLYLIDLVMDATNDFINSGILTSTGVITLNKDYSSNGTITGNTLIGNNNQLTLPYGSFKTLDNVTITAGIIAVSDIIRNNVIIENTLTISGNVTQIGNLNAKDITGADTLIITGSTSVTHELTLNSLYIDDSASLTVATIEYKQLLNNSGVTVVNNFKNTNAKIVQAGILKILGSNTVTLNNNFHQYGTTEITKATVNIAEDIVVKGHLLLKNLLAEYKSTNKFIKIDINENSTILIKENIGDTNKLDKKIVFINEGSLILSNKSSINGNIEIYDKFYNPEVLATGIVQIEGNITQQGKLNLGKFLSNNNNKITIKANSIVKCNSAMQQQTISIVNNGTLEIAQGSSLNNYKGKQNSCLVLALHNIDNMKSATNPALQLNQQAVFNTNSTIKLKPQTRIIPQFANNQIYLINTTKGIVNGSGSNITNIKSLVKSIDTESTLLKLTNIRLINSNHSLVADLQVNRIFPDANMQSADMQLLHSLLGSCQPQDAIIEAACWNYNKNKTNNMLIYPDILALDKIAIYDDENAEFIVDAKNKNQYNTIYANNNPAICLGTTISSNTLVSNSTDTINLTKMQFNNLNINAARINPLLNSVTKTSNEDGIVITGVNPIILYDEMLISDTVKIEAGIDCHALHLAVPIIGTINNYGNIGSEKSGYGVAITQILQGEFNNFNLIAGDKAAIIINPMTSSSGKKLTIVNEGTIIGSIIIEATNNINYPHITLKNSANIRGREINSDKNLEFSIINTSSGTIYTNNLRAQQITNKGGINTFEFDVYDITNTGEITVTNSMNLYADITNNGIITANIIDGRGYQLTNINNILTAAILKNIKIYNRPVSLQQGITNNVYIQNKLNIDKKYNVTIDASSTLQVGSIKINGTLENNGELIIFNDNLECLGYILNQKQALVDTKNYNIVLAATLTNNGIITTNNILGTSCTVNNNTGAILNLQRLGNSKQTIIINNDGTINLNKELRVSDNQSNIIDGNIYINRGDINQHNGELNIYTNVYQQNQSNLYLGKINCFNKADFYIAEHAKTVISNRVNQDNLSIENKGSVTLQALSTIDKYSGYNISRLVLPISSHLSSYGDNHLLTIEDDCVFHPGAKLLLKLSEALQNSILLQRTKINLLKVKKSITYNERTITKKEIKNIIEFNHLNLVITLDNSDIQINKDTKDYTLISINITATGELPHGFGYGYIFLDKSILGKCQPKDEKISCFFHKENLDNHGSPTACNLGIYPSFVVVNPARVTINRGNIQIGSPTSNTKEYITEYIGNHPALILATNIESENITDDTNDILEFNSFNISNIDIIGNNHENSTGNFQPQDGLLITGQNALKINNDIQIATNTNILAGKNKHALHLAAPIVANITNFGVIGSSINDSGIKISNSFQGEIINWGNISASNTAINIDIDASNLVNMKNMVLTNKKQINGSVIANVKDSALTQSIVKSSNLAVIDPATISLTNYAEINDCYKLIDTDLLSMKIINQGGIISAENIAVKLIDNYGIIQNVSTLNLVNSTFINNNNAKLKLISGSSITINNNNFINNGETYAFNISLNNNFNNNGFINIANIFNGNSYIFDTNSHSNLECNTLKDIHLTGNTERVTIKSALIGKIIVDDVLLLRKSISQLGKLNAREIIVDSTYKDNIFVINGTVDAINCKLKHLNNGLSGLLRTNNLILQQQSNNSGVINTSYLFIDDKLINSGTINITNNMDLTPDIINNGYINSEKNISISPNCSNDGILIANIIDSGTISTLLNNGTIKIKSLGDINSDIKIVNQGHVFISNDAVIQGSITITNTAINTQGNLYIKNAALTLKGLVVATTSTFNIDNKSCVLLTDNLNQEKLSIINNATLELSNYNKINNYDGRNASLILRIDQELNSIVDPIIDCKQHAIFNSNSKILLKPSVILNNIAQNTITLVEAAKGIKFDITQNAKLPELIDLTTKNISNLFIDSIENNSLFFKIYNPQLIDANKKLICQVKLLYDLEKFSKNMMYASILLDKDLIGNCINKNSSIFAITWVCNKTDEQINSNNLAISPLSLMLKEKVISYNCQDKILIFSGASEDVSIEKITATNNIATAIICSEIETNNKVIDTPKAKILELNGIQIDNIEITGINNTYGNNIAVDGILITGRHPLKISTGSEFHIGKNAVIKATGDKHALHIATKFIGNINNYGTIGSKNSGNGIYISQPILTTLTNYHIISSSNRAITVCATNDWVLNNENLTLINNGNIEGSLLFTTTNTLTNTKYTTNVYNNKSINSDSIIAKNGMILNINNNGSINSNTIKINTLINYGTISVIGNNGITINNDSINHNAINVSYCNLNGNKLINEKSAFITCNHLASAQIKNYGLLSITNKLSGNILVDNTLTLGSSIEQSGVLTTDNMATHNTKLKVLGSIKVANDIKLQQLENLSTANLYSNKGLIIENSSTNSGIIDVSYFQTKDLFTNNKTGKLNIRDASLIVDNYSLINLGSINTKKLILSGTFTNHGKIIVNNFLGNNNILLAATNSQINANKLTDITILGTADIKVAKLIEGKVNIDHKLGLSGNITNTGELTIDSLNTNNYKFNIASSGSVTVSSPLGLTIDNNFTNNGNLQVLHKLKLQNTFTNNGAIKTYLLDGNNNKFINNDNLILDIIKNSILINKGSITVNNSILGENLIDGKLNIGTKVFQNGSLTIGSIEAITKSEFIIDNDSNVSISSLMNNNLNITNYGSLVVNGRMIVNSYKAQGGILTIQVDSKLTKEPFLQARQEIHINSLLGNQALITISATQGIPRFKQNKVIIATAKSLLVNNNKMLDTDLSYLLAVKKIASTSLLLNITNVGIDRNDNQEAIYANLEYINIADIKQIKNSPVSIRRFASYLQNSKILQLEPYILELIRNEIKHYRLHRDTENEALYFLQEHHPRAYKSLIAKIRNKILNSIDTTKQNDDYQQVINVINSYLHKHYQQQVIEENKAINLAATAKKHIVDGTITNNTLYISDKVIQNKNIILDSIVADTEAEFYITHNAKVKINDFNSTNINLVNSGLLKVTDNLVLNSYTSWGGCLAINVEKISNKPIILVNNDVNLNDTYANKPQIILTTNNFNKVGTVQSGILMLQAKKITLNNELLQDSDLSNILAMQQVDSILLKLSNPKQIISNNSHKILVDLSWVDAKKLLLTDNNPVSLAQLAEKLQQPKYQDQQTNIFSNVNKNQFKISNDLLITGTLTANQLIADRPVLFTIDNHALANIDIIDNTDIDIVNNGTLNTSPGVNVNSYTANGGNLIFNISDIINRPFLQANNNIEFNSNNNKLPTIILQYSNLTITENTYQITLAKAKKILLDGDDLLEADVNNLVKYQKVASSSILCKLDNISIARTASDEEIQAQLSIVDIKTIKAIDDKPISVKQLAQLMQQPTSINTNNTVLNFIEKQITAGKLSRDMHSIYKKFTSKTTDNNQQLNQILNNIEALYKDNDNNLSSYLNELLPDNSCVNLQSIFSISKQSVLNINNHNAIQAKFNFMANKYFSLNAATAYTTPLWFSIKQQQYRTNNANNYFNAVTNSEVYSMGLEKNYNKFNIGYLLNYGVATTANLNIDNYNKNTNNQVTSVISAIYTNYNLNSFVSYAGFLVAKNKHCYTNTNKLLNDSYNSNYISTTTALFYNLTTNAKFNNLAFRFNSGVYFMNVKFPEYNATSVEIHSSYSRKLISLYTTITFMYNMNLFKNKFTKINFSLNYSHDFNINNNNNINNININLLDHNFIISQKKINYKEFNLDTSIDINLTKNSNVIFTVNDSLSSNGNRFNIKLKYYYKI